MWTMTDEIIGKTLGQYEIIEEIGRGGMATVYRARQTSMNRIVAVKVLPRNLLHDPGFYERFEREVDVVAHLEHPHILPIYDYGKDEGVPYIVMRYLGGGSLRDLIRRGLPPVADLEKPFTQIAQALDHAHREGVIHRDLKPGNVMLDNMGNAYLTDFGIARVLGSDLTGSAIIGTPAYMSPEQANGIPLDARSDVYSLGVVLFELVTGREPFQAETPMALLLKHINEPMPAARTYRPEVSPALDVVIARATAKNPDDRYPSAGEMARALRETLQVATPLVIEKDNSPTFIPAVPPEPLTTRLPQATHTQAQPLTPTPAEPQYSRSTRWSGLVLLVIVLVVLAVLPTLTASPPVPTQDVPGTQQAFADWQAVAPTPFSGAQRVAQPQYSINIPRDLIPPQGYYDLSDEQRIIHIWQDADLRQYVALEILRDSPSIEDEADFRTAVDDYTGRYVLANEALTLIDEATAPDGTLRRSYRLVGNVQPPFPSGQLDIFYPASAPQFTALHLYTADETGNRLVPELQQILDSLRLVTP